APARRAADFIAPAHTVRGFHSFSPRGHRAIDFRALRADRAPQSRSSGGEDGAARLDLRRVESPGESRRPCAFAAHRRRPIPGRYPDRAERAADRRLPGSAESGENRRGARSLPAGFAARRVHGASPTGLPRHPSRPVRSGSGARRRGMPGREPRPARRRALGQRSRPARRAGRARDDSLHLRLDGKAQGSDLRSPPLGSQREKLRQHFFISCEDRVTLLSLGTSQAVKNICMALLNGAALFPFEVRQKGLDEFLALLEREKITITVLGASLFRSLADVLPKPEQLTHLRLIRLGSEPVQKSDLELYKKHFPPTCLLVNGLASGETATTRFYALDRSSETAASIVPVGYST